MFLSLKSEKLQQGAQQVVLRRAWLCLCGRLTAKQRLEDIEIGVHPSGHSWQISQFAIMMTLQC